MQKGMGGYFTVEAAMVLPMVLGVIVLIVYLLFFQYDRCLQEQDMGILALRGSVLQTENQEERASRMRIQVEQVNKEKYIAWEYGTIEWKLEKGTVNVKQNSYVKFPFGGRNYGSHTWTSTVAYRNQILSPVSFVRNSRKLIGGR